MRSKVIQERAEEVVRYHLMSTTADLAGQLERGGSSSVKDVAFLAGVPLLNWYVADRSAPAVSDDGEVALTSRDRSVFDEFVERLLNNLVALSSGYSRVLAVDRSGNVVGWNTTLGDVALTAEDLERCASLFYGDDEWFQRCMRDGYAAVDFHRSEFGPPEGPGSQLYQVGFAARIDPLDLDESPGVVVAFMDWTHIRRWSRATACGVSAAGGCDKPGHLSIVLRVDLGARTRTRSWRTISAVCTARRSANWNRGDCGRWSRPRARRPTVCTPTTSSAACARRPRSIASRATWDSNG
ncbi:MAG: hypothetical protein R3F17_06920 [Planctomycetota bacterium]